MTKRFKDTPLRYRNDRPPPPRPPNVPQVRTLDGAISYIAKHRAFTATKLQWEDRDSEGNVIATATYNIYGRHTAVNGVVKGYLLHNYTPSPEYCWDENALFYWDKQTDQWYANEGNPEALDHPLEPCVPPDKSIIPLPSRHLRYLMRTSVMDLMQAKLDGSLDHVYYMFNGKGLDNMTWTVASGFPFNQIITEK